MTEWDAPNQQVVRPDESAPWEEGNGGSEGAAPKSSRSDDEPSLDEMTKAQLHAHADSIGVEVHDEMTKAEIKQAIEDA